MAAAHFEELRSQAEELQRRGLPNKWHIVKIVAFTAAGIFFLLEAVLSLNQTKSDRIAAWSSPPAPSSLRAALPVRPVASGCAMAGIQALAADPKTWLARDLPRRPVAVASTATKPDVAAGAVRVGDSIMDPGNKPATTPPLR
nr:unnamed protein product [Digitaria exilis]